MDVGSFDMTDVSDAGLSAVAGAAGPAGADGPAGAAGAGCVAAAVVAQSDVNLNPARTDIASQGLITLRTVS